jgi:hypothetical protein
MVRSTSSSVRCALLAWACGAALTAAQAQTAPATTPAAAPAQAPAGDSNERNPEGRRNQKIERIHVEDGGATVDELRYGGQTQNITVTPKGRMPPYEVKPNSSNNRTGTGAQGQGEAGGSGNGPAVWNVLKF